MNRITIGGHPTQNRNQNEGLLGSFHIAVEAGSRTEAEILKLLCFSLSNLSTALAKWHEVEGNMKVKDVLRDDTIMDIHRIK